VISIKSATWCLGVVFAAIITGIAAANWGWRVAVMVPAAIALLAIYVRATCPESPYWVRAQDRKRRIAETLTAGGALNEDDRVWYTKIGRVGITQVFMPDVPPATLVALFVACSSCCIFGTVGRRTRPPPPFSRLRRSPRATSQTPGNPNWGSGWRTGRT
jgi:MFS family permease